jgi:hypothetical protein
MVAVVGRRGVSHYRAMIDGCDFRTVKGYLRSPGGDIREVVVVGEGEDLAAIAAHLDADRPTRRQRSLELARHRAIRFAVERPSDVPYPWTRFVVRLDEIEDGQWCRVIYAPPTYYVELVG